MAIDGETVETVSNFILGGSKITADCDCSHEIKRCLLLERKVMTNLDSILKSRDITLSTMVCLVKAMVFLVVYMDVTSFLCVWFPCVCPLMPSCNTYHLTRVSLTLGMGYLFTAAPAKRSCCSLPWMRGISSPPPFLTFNVGWLL